MVKSYENFDKPYRRGLILGLSLAELFLILLFSILFEFDLFYKFHYQQNAKAPWPPFSAQKTASKRPLILITGFISGIPAYEDRCKKWLKIRIYPSIKNLYSALIIPLHAKL